MPPQSLRILTLDGAGLKGLSELFILQHLFQRVKSITGVRDIQPCDVFDLLAGSSTGGLNAIFLGRMVMSVEDSIDAYCRIGAKVFEIPKDDQAGGGRTKKALRKLVSGPSQSRTVILMEEMMGVLADKHDVAARFNVEDKIEDEEYYDDHSWRVMLSVTRKGRNSDDPDLIRNWRSEVQGQKNYTACVWEAASAVCAVLPLFQEHVRLEQHGDKLYAATKGRANPIADVLAEMKREKSLLGHDIACLVSVGAGKLTPDDVVPERLKTAVEMMAAAEEAAERFVESGEGKELRDKEKYFRFNLPVDMQELGIDECSDVEKVMVAVEKYIGHESVKGMLEKCAQQLASTVRISSGKVK